MYNFYPVMGLRELNESNTRKLIIGTAFELFCTRGIEGTEMRQVARAARIGHATLYRYYENRDVLATEVYIENLSILADTFFGFNPGESMSEIIRQCFGNLVLCYRLHPKRLVFDLVFNLYALRQHNDPTRFPEHFMKNERYTDFVTLITASIHDGTLKEGITQEDIFAVLESFTGYLQRLCTFEQQSDVTDRSAHEEAVERLSQLSLGMLVAEK